MRRTSSPWTVAKPLTLGSGLSVRSTALDPTGDLASAISGSEAFGAEAVQDAFARAIRSRKSFRGDSALEAWVWRIVVNTARRNGSRERRQAVAPTGWEDNGSPASDRDSEVLGWIAALPERQREAVFLRYFADLEHGTIKVGILHSLSGTMTASERASRSQ